MRSHRPAHFNNMADAKEITEITATPANSSEIGHSKTAAAASETEDGSSFEQRKSVIWWRRIVGAIWDTEAQTDTEYRKYVKRLDRIFLYVLSLLFSR